MTHGGPIEPSRLYSGNGLDWVKQLQWHLLDTYVFEHLFLQHMCSVNFLIVSTPFRMPASNMCWDSKYFSTHKVSRNYNTSHHAQ